MKRFLDILMTLAVLCSLLGTIQVSADPGRAAVNSSSSMIKRTDLSTVFQSDSYWVMSDSHMHFYAGKIIETPTHYVHLDVGIKSAEIISVEGDDLRMVKHYDWEYDKATGILRIHSQADEWNSGDFHFQDGAFVAQGARGETLLRLTSDARSKFEAAYHQFSRNYGQFNPAKRLVTSNADDRFRDISEWGADNYPFFREYVLPHTFGIVKPGDPDNVNAIRNEFGSMIHLADLTAFRVDQVLFDFNHPEENDGYIYFDNDVDVINLVYTDLYNSPNGRGSSRVYEIFEKMPIEALLREGVAKKSEKNTADHFSCRFAWNDKQAVATVHFGPNIVIFRGPTSCVRKITEELQLGDYLWYVA